MSTTSGACGLGWISCKACHVEVQVLFHMDCSPLNLIADPLPSLDDTDAAGGLGVHLC